MTSLDVVDRFAVAPRSVQDIRYQITISEGSFFRRSGDRPCSHSSLVIIIAAVLGCKRGGERSKPLSNGIHTSTLQASPHCPHLVRGWDPGLRTRGKVVTLFSPWHRWLSSPNPFPSHSAHYESGTPSSPPILPFHARTIRSEFDGLCWIRNGGAECNSALHKSRLFLPTGPPLLLIFSGNSSGRITYSTPPRKLSN